MALLNEGNRAVEAYLDGLAADRRAALAELRALVLETEPDAVEAPSETIQKGGESE